MKRNFGESQVDDARAWVRHELKQMDIPPLGFTIEIKPRKRRHTDNQRGYYWQAINSLGAECGYSPNSLHEVMLNETFGTKETLHIGGQYIAIPNKRSHDLNVEDYGTLIDTLLRISGEMGFPVEDPRAA